MKEVKAYQCEFCKKPRLFLSKSGAKKHEEKCWMNPIRKSCGTCQNLLMEIIMGSPYNWYCIEYKETQCKPFKNKIENCEYYKQSTPFNDED